jgi:predicted ferric reductase
VHLATYAGIALGYFHQIPTGNELVLNRGVDDYWRGLYLATLAVLIVFRVLAPLRDALRYRLRVVEVRREGLGVVSVRMTGRNLDRLRARPGQFFLWRFLDRKQCWTAHPFSLSAAPDGSSLRITVKSLGDHSSRMGELRPGTRVVAEGPFGVFTEASRHGRKVLLIAGGIGITPIRALLETMQGDLVVLYRVIDESNVIFREELDRLTSDRVVLHVVAGDHQTEEGRQLLAPEHLRRLVPDIAEREVYLCGPPAMTDAIRRNIRAVRVPRRRIHTERFALT